MMSWLLPFRCAPRARLCECGGNPDDAVFTDAVASIPSSTPPMFQLFNLNKTTGFRWITDAYQGYVVMLPVFTHTQQKTFHKTARNKCGKGIRRCRANPN